MIRRDVILIKFIGLSKKLMARVVSIARVCFSDGITYCS